MNKLKWQQIGDVTERVESARLWVPGGWIVRTIVTRMEAGAHCSQMFVSDPLHEWGDGDALQAVEPLVRGPG